jgi:hypothetical protein
VQVCTAHAQTDSASVDEQLAVANRSIIDGHVKDGVNRLELLLGQLDPTRDRDAYWRTAATLIEWLSQTENHAEETKVLNTLAAAKIWENQPAYVPWMQFFVGRNLAFTGHTPMTLRNTCILLPAATQDWFTFPFKEQRQLYFRKLSLTEIT